jgi:hypothetical protein
MEGISSFHPNDAYRSVGDGRDIFDGFLLQGNMMKVDRIHSFMGIISGCVAGVTGLTGWVGIGMDLSCVDARVCLLFSVTH